MNTEQKLDAIIVLLQSINSSLNSRLPPEPIITANPYASPVCEWAIKAKPGYYTAADIAAAIGRPYDLTVGHAIGRAMDALKIPRFRKKDHRGFIVNMDRPR